MRTVVAAALVALVAPLAACGGSTAERLVPGGDPHRGAARIEEYGCGSCHTIPGIVGADGKVGPSLAGFADRRFVGGVLPNTPDNVVAWIVSPKRFSPQTVMPDLGVARDEARDITAYLYDAG